MILNIHENTFLLENSVENSYFSDWTFEFKGE